MTDRKVSPGEYCTMVTAQELGILDAQAYKKGGAAAPFSGVYNDLKTYNSEVDAKDKRAKSICKSSLDGKEAYPHCTAVYGPGFVKMGTSDSSQPFKCQVQDCPPGFTRQGDYCNKEPLFADAKIDKRSRCDGRWYDWFVTPNYHLGNKYYEESVGKCYMPCPVRHVPAFAKDPVDGSRLDITSEDNLTQCVPRESFFAGKYAQGTDYCPLAWIMRVYASNPKHALDLITTKRRRITDLYGNQKDQSKNRVTDMFRRLSDRNDSNTIAESHELAQRIGGYLDNVESPSGPMQQACATLNVADNLNLAYEVCKELHDQGSVEISSDPTQNAKQNIVLKQACNAVFCNEGDDSLDIISKDPICFDKPRALSENELGSDETTDPQAPTYDSQQSFFRKSLGTFVLVVFVPIFLTVSYFAWSRLLWPRVLRPVIFFLMRILTGRTYAALKFREARMAEIDNVRGQMLRSKR